MKEEWNILNHLNVKKVATPDEAIFRNMADVAMNATPRRNPKGKIIKMSLIVVGIAAVLTLILWTIGSGNVDQSLSQEKISFSEVKDTDLLNYLEDNLDDFDEEDIFNAVQNVEDSIVKDKTIGIQNPMVGNLEEMLANLSDEELKKFFEDEPLEEEDELVTIF
jgi:hypothetical protein